MRRWRVLSLGHCDIAAAMLHGGARDSPPTEVADGQDPPFEDEMDEAGRNTGEASEGERFDDDVVSRLEMGTAVGRAEGCAVRGPGLGRYRHRMA